MGTAIVLLEKLVGQLPKKMEEYGVVPPSPNISGRSYRFGRIVSEIYTHKLA